MIRKALSALGTLVVAAAMFIGAMAFLGIAIDRKAERDVEHDRCLKEATNGYEIKQCR